jgi:hypothetical protein
MLPPSGWQGAMNSMRFALEDANAAPDINHINTHGTSTRWGLPSKSYCRPFWRTFKKIAVNLPSR